HHVRGRVRGQPAAGGGVPGSVRPGRDELHGRGGRPVGRGPAGVQARGPALPGNARMLTRGWRRALAALAVSGGLSLAVLPAPARADTIRDNQQWVLNMLNVPSVWAETEGRGVTVAVIDSGVNPKVSDLTGSVTTGPDYTGVSTSPSSTEWGVHGTWMGSLIAVHGHEVGDRGVVSICPHR